MKATLQATLPSKRSRYSRTLPQRTSAGRHPVHGGEVIQQLFQLLGRRRSVGQAVHAHQFGGHPLAQLDLVPGIG